MERGRVRELKNEFRKVAEKSKWGPKRVREERVKKWRGL